MPPSSALPISKAVFCVVFTLLPVLTMYAGPTDYGSPAILRTQGGKHKNARFRGDSLNIRRIPKQKRNIFVKYAARTEHEEWWKKDTKCVSRYHIRWLNGLFQCRCARLRPASSLSDIFFLFFSLHTLPSPALHA